MLYNYMLYSYIDIFETSQVLNDKNSTWTFIV